jgi:hypothetical protein
MKYFLLLVLFIVFPQSGTAQTNPFAVNMDNCGPDRAFVASLRERIAEPLLRTFHDILMDNELAGGCGALQFTDAGMASGTNGFSFGPSQFDLATRQNESLTALGEILACRPESPAQPSLTPADLQFVLSRGPEGRGTEATASLRRDRVAWNRFIGLRPAIEAALRSRCGRDLLAARYLDELRSLWANAQLVWQAASANNPDLAAAERFYLLYALDLENVLGGATGFRNHARDRRIVVCFALCDTGEVGRFGLGTTVVTTDLIRYVLGYTCYGYIPEETRQFDELRRLNRVLSEVDLTTLPLTAADRRYLTEQLADLVANAEAAQPGARLDRLKALITLANGGIPLAPRPQPVEARRLMALQAICASLQ